MTYYLLKNPEAMRKLRQEVDEVIGGATPTVDHMTKLPYLTGAFLELIHIIANIPHHSRLA